jgi:hypothetical protein
MAEVLVRFVEPVVRADELAYTAQACGAAMPDGRWEGWVEFIPMTGGTPVRTPRETTQPNRADAEYWASGLTPTYLEGALERALRRPVLTTPPPAEPIFDTPAPDFVTLEAPDVRGDAVLDPFSVYEKGEELLRRQLGALSERHLVNIIVAYDLSNEPLAVLNQLSQATLIDLIVEAVRQQM